jgi:oleate hydratase
MPDPVLSQRPPGERPCYIVGGGIAGLACAVFLIRDGCVPGGAIHLFEEADLLGGSLDAQGSAEAGYVIRGGRMLDEAAHTCLFDLLSVLPSAGDPAVSLKDEVVAFNRDHRYHSHCRLVEGGRSVDHPAFGLGWKDRLALARLWFTPESFLGCRRIQDVFRPAFFASNFWVMWSTIFAFQPWHSAAEFRRYMRRLVQWVETLPTLEGVVRTPLNQYEYLVRPVAQWLKERGVQFHPGTRVTDLGFGVGARAKTVERIRCATGGAEMDISVPDGGLVFVTLGSMTAGTRVGSMSAPAGQPFRESTGSWTLWEALAKGRPELGRPAAFNGNPALSRWLSFTLTLRSPLFPELVERFTGNETGTGGLVTFKNSGWLLSAVMLHRPHFLGQPEGVNVCWGYGLRPDDPGDHVRKPMAECSGAEILAELCHQFGFADRFPEIATTSTCIPCEMPYITSQFMPRATGDRPAVVPAGYRNLAFLGQFCEIPGDTVFTVEYSVRSAQTAVSSLLGLRRQVPSIYKGQYDPRVVWRAVRAVCR